MQRVPGPYVMSADDKELKGNYGRKKACIQKPALHAGPHASRPRLCHPLSFSIADYFHDIPRRPTVQGCLFQHGGWKNRKLFLRQPPLCLLMVVMVVC